MKKALKKRTTSRGASKKKVKKPANSEQPGDIQLNKIEESWNLQEYTQRGMDHSTFYTDYRVDLEMIKQRFRQDIYLTKDCGTKGEVSKYEILYDNNIFVGFLCHNTPINNRYKIVVIAPTEKKIQSCYHLLINSPQIRTSYESLIAHFQSERRFVVVDELKKNLQNLTEKKISKKEFLEEMNNILIRAKKEEIANERMRSVSRSSISELRGESKKRTFQDTNNGNHPPKRVRHDSPLNKIFTSPNPNLRSEAIRNSEELRKGEIQVLIRSSRPPPLNWPGQSVRFEEEYKTDLGLFYVVMVAIHVSTERVPFLSAWIQECCRKFNKEKNRLEKEETSRRSQSNNNGKQPSMSINLPTSNDLPMATPRYDNTKKNRNLMVTPMGTVSNNVISERIEVISNLEEQRKTPLFDLVQNSRAPPLNWPGTSIQFTEEYKTALGRFYVIEVAIHISAEKIIWLSPWIQEYFRKFDIEKRRIQQERRNNDTEEKKK